MREFRILHNRYGLLWIWFLFEFILCGKNCYEFDFSGEMNKVDEIWLESSGN